MQLICSFHLFSYFVVGGACVYVCSFLEPEIESELAPQHQ